METQPNQALTLADALNLAFSIQRVNVNADMGRLQRGYAIAVAAINGFGDYEIASIGKTFVTRRCYYAVSKFNKATGHNEAGYIVNLKKELACNCPDSQDHGQINCKHVLGVVLWQQAHDIYHAYVKETI